jgi:hypothetical protein
MEDDLKNIIKNMEEDLKKEKRKTTSKKNLD